MATRAALVGSILASVLCLAGALEDRPADAKGEQYLEGATIRGGGLRESREVKVFLPDGYDEMSEVPDIEWQDGIATRRPGGSTGEALAYEVILHYNFARYGYGTRDWAGRFDGHDLLYFPDSMVVGPGEWRAGWYRASPMLARALQGRSTLLPVPLPLLPTVTAAAFLLVVGLALVRVLPRRG